MALPKRSETKQKLLADKDTSESESDDSQSLSDIDDAEVAPYLSNKKEAFYKRIIWEVMYKGHTKGNSRKRARKVMKAAPARKAVKVSAEMDCKKRPSSKINYDALKKLNEEEGNDRSRSEQDGHGDMQPSNEKFNCEAQSSGGSFDDELDYENDFCEEAEARQGHDDNDTYFENDDYNEYGCDEEYGFD